MHGGGDGFTADPAEEGGGLLLGGRDLLCDRDKRHPALIQEIVEDHAEGVEVGVFSVRFVAVDFGGHVVGGAGDRCVGGPFHPSGDAEVAEFIVAEIGDEDILGLDIPVDDLPVVADDQRFAEVPSEPGDLLFGEAAFSQDIAQGGQELHADIHAEASAVRPVLGRIILAADDVGMPFQLHHHAVFAQEVFFAVAAHLPDALGRISFALQFFQHAFLRVGDHFHGGPFDRIADGSGDLIDHSEAAASELSAQVPALPGDVYCICHCAAPLL